MGKYLILILILIVNSNSIYSAEKLDKTLYKFIEQSISDTITIPEARKSDLLNISKLIKSQPSKKIVLNWIDESNAHISVLYQNLGKAIAIYLKENKIDFSSYGIHATEYSEKAVRALKTAGFCIFKMGEGANCDYDFRFELLGSLRTVHSLKVNDKMMSKPGSINILLTSKTKELKSNFIENTYFFNCDEMSNEMDKSKEQKLFDKNCKQISAEMYYLLTNSKK